MEHKLCQKCKEAIIEKWGKKAFLLPWQHCHHEEPKIDYQKPWREAAEKVITFPGSLHYQSTPVSPEKPKEPCWCDADLKAQTVRIGNKWWNNILFCPHCGRRL